ncbi:MAG TPA: DUF3427 domain-containing protein [Aggregatilineales bacterium]|nr:DUF3427 domain-containing protein [Aggregatilineales bacterium]
MTHHPRISQFNEGNRLWHLSYAPTPFRLNQRLMRSEELTLHQEYSRQQIHDLFEPETAFTPQAGTWGLHGIIRLSERPGDFVLIVTFGQSQGIHTFDEGISTQGILRWQSQPRQGLNDKTIRELIDHDEDQHAVYLFLRTAPRMRGGHRATLILARLNT